MRYDPETAPDSAEWLALDEADRLELASAHHREPEAQRLHGVVHVVVENQLAEGIELVRETLDRLKAEGLSRHEAIHAIGSVLLGHLWNLLREGAKTLDPNDRYFKDLETLTLASWREKFGTMRKRIPYGATLPVTMTVRERALIRETAGCDPDFARFAVVEGAEIRVELSLDDIEEIQGYVAAEANHTTNAKRRKELDRLFHKLQEYLDTYDDQSE